MSQLVSAVGVPMRGVWLSGEDKRVMESFYEGYLFQDIVRARVISRPGAAFHRLGVYGTPTSYLLDSFGKLRYGIMGDRLPSVEMVRESCM